MLILERLICRSSRSLAVTIGFALAGSRRRPGERSDGPDDGSKARADPSLPLLAPRSPHFLPAAASATVRRGHSIVRKGEPSWIADPF